MLKKLNSRLNSIFRFYFEGFRDMSSWGRKVWIIILVKLFIMFAILRVLFFPDFLNKNFDNDTQRSDYVMDQLLNNTNSND